jgi:ATP-binding cassette subfamily F protein uup
VLRGETLQVGYYSQAGIKLPLDVRVLDFVKDTAEQALALSQAAGEGEALSGEALARQLLQRFNFPIARWADQVAKLSGGERRRLQLLSVLAQRPNFLLLDEVRLDAHR